MKTGIVLEGGGMRGMYSAGILDVMMENGIEVDGIVGVSAGAVFGGNYKSRQIGRAISYNRKVCRDPRYGTFRSLFKTGDMYEVKFCYETIPNEIAPVDDEAYIANSVEFYVTCADVETGEAVYHKSESMKKSIKWIQASASMPLVSKPVEIDGKKYLDGGIVDSIPISFFRQQGFDKNIVVLTRPRGYVKGKNKLTWLARILLRKYPAIVKAMSCRHIGYNKTLKELEVLKQQGDVLLFYPEESAMISRTEHNPEKLQMCYEAGRNAALSRLEELRDFCNKSV